MKKINVPDRIGDWRRELEIKKQIHDDYLNALIFSGSNLTIGDLNDFYKEIVLLSRKSKKVSLDELRKKFKKYNESEFQDLIKRLMMLGEIYDPCKIYIKRKNKDEGKFISLI